MPVHCLFMFVAVSWCAATSWITASASSSAATPSSVTPEMSSGVTEGIETVSLPGTGASLPSTLYYEWLALYSYTRQRQPTESVQVIAPYTTYDSNQGKQAMYNSPDYYQYGATDIEMSSLEAALVPNFATVPVVAG